MLHNTFGIQALNPRPAILDPEPPSVVLTTLTPAGGGGTVALNSWRGSGGTSPFIARGDSEVYQYTLYTGRTRRLGCLGGGGVDMEGGRAGGANRLDDVSSGAGGRD